MKRKILYLSPSNRMLGARISLLHQLKYLDQDKYEAIVVSLDNRDGFLEALDNMNVRYYRLRLWNWRKARFWWRIPSTLWQLVKIIRKENIDLIHSNEFWCTPYGVIAGKWFSKIPAITHIRLYIDQKKARQYFLKWADVIVTVSMATGNLLKDWKYYDKVTTVYNGLDPKLFTGYEEKKRSFRDEFKLSEDDIAIGEIAQIHPRKNQHKVLEIIPGIIEKYPRVYFFFIGDSRSSSYERELKNRARSLNIDQHCIFLGPRKDIPRICAGLDINILPSTQEGFGRILIESMYMYTAVIGSNAGGISEVIRHEECGYIFPVEKFDVFQEYLERLIIDKDLRYKMGKKGHDIVRQNFMASHCARKIEEIYDSLLDKQENTS